MSKRQMNLVCVLGALTGLLVAGVSVKPASAEPKAAGAKAMQVKTAAAKSDAKPKPPIAAAPVADDAADKARRAEVVATFEGGSVTVGDLEDAIESQSPFMRQRYLEKDARKALLDKTLRFELLAGEAVRRGYDKNDVVSFAVKQNAVQAMIKQEFDDKNNAASIPAADVKQYYDAHLDEFVRPELRRGSQVLVATEAEAKALLADAKPADMRTFRELARNKSIDQETKLRGGDLRYFDSKGRIYDETAPAIDPAIAKAVFTLKVVGDTTDVIKVAQGFAVVKLTGQRAAHEESPKDADETIRTRLWRDRRQAGIDALLDRLKKEHKPEVHPELVDAIKFDAAAPLPPAANLPQGFPVKAN